MKRLSAIFLSLCLLAAALCVPAAAEGGYTLTLRTGETTSRQEQLTECTLPSAKAPDGKVFAGWRTEEGKLYPAGATLALSADTELEALFVGMAVISPELRSYGENDTAIRFLTNVNAADYAALSAAAEAVSLGTLIAPRSYVTAQSGNVLTPEALALGGKTNYLDVKATGFYRFSTDTLTIAGSVCSILSQNSTNSFLGVGYLSVRYADGTEARLYAPTDRTCTGSYYAMLCTAVGDNTISAEVRTLYEEKLSKFVSVSYSNGEYEKRAGSDAFDVTSSKTNVDNSGAGNGQCTLTVKKDSDFRFDRDMQALICDGAVRLVGYSIEEDGTVLWFEYSDYTQNY